jgi:hypothetical protein
MHYWNDSWLWKLRHWNDCLFIIIKISQTHAQNLSQILLRKWHISFLSDMLMCSHHYETINIPYELIDSIYILIPTKRLKLLYNSDPNI